jgi:hypothetical protein
VAVTMTRTHGNAAVPELLAGDGRLEQVDGHAYTDVIGLASGGGRTFRISGSPLLDTWFCIPVPTITILADRPMFLDNFFLFFTSDSLSTGDPVTVEIRVIQIWDGNAMLFSWEPPFTAFSGDWSFPRQEGEASNTFFPRIPGSDLRFGINTGLSFRVAATSEFGSGNVTFHSAGATWIDSQD